MPRWKWILIHLTRQLWIRATLIGALGIIAALLGTVAHRFIPLGLSGAIGADAVGSILNIIASSMLAVTTFSLSVMTSAYGSATSNVTPRATRLLMEDKATHNVLSAFIGSFLFSIVGIVALQTGVYGEQGRVTLFAVTLGVIALIVVSLLSWIDHLIRLGRVSETTGRVEEATRRALQARLEAPHLGGAPPHEGRGAPDGAAVVPAGAVGYVQHIDIAALSTHAEALEGDIHVAVLPGSFVYLDTPLARVPPGQGESDGDDTERLDGVRKAFTIASERTFDQDPRFGLAVLSEIASRALSPGINDPGTAIDVVGRVTRLLTAWAQGCDTNADGEIQHPRVHVPSLRVEDLFEDSFMLIARDGAGMIEVQLRIRKALLALARIGDPDFRAAARRQAELALQRADAALTAEADRRRLRADDGQAAG